MSEFRFQLLGPVQAWRDGEAVEAGSPRQAVPAMLLPAWGDHQTGSEHQVHEAWLSGGSGTAPARQTRPRFPSADDLCPLG